MLGNFGRLGIFSLNLGISLVEFWDFCGCVKKIWLSLGLFWQFRDFMGEFRDFLVACREILFEKGNFCFVENFWKFRIFLWSLGSLWLSLKIFLA